MQQKSPAGHELWMLQLHGQHFKHHRYRDTPTILIIVSDTYEAKKAKCAVLPGFMLFSIAYQLKLNIFGLLVGQKRYLFI